MDNTFDKDDFVEDQDLQAREGKQSRRTPSKDTAKNIREATARDDINPELTDYIEAIARLNDTIDSDDKFEFCTAYYDADNNDKLTPNQKTYGYEPTGNEKALGLGVPEGFILYDFDLPPNDKFRKYYKQTWGHTGTKPEGCGHLLFKCKAPHSSMTNATLTIFASSVELCRKGYRPAFTPGSRKVKGGDITHHWNGIETVLNEPQEFRRERMRESHIPSTPPKKVGTTATTAQEIALALGGREVRSGWSAHCPAHDDNDPSFFIREVNGSPRFKCHAGCTQKAIIDALKIRGLLGGEATPDDKKTFALQTWEESKLAENTLVEAYLASLGWNLPIPPSIRFHPDLKHPDGDSFPCMVALITHSQDESPMAIHRTFLTHDGKEVAPVQHPRMRLGACKGCVVRLGEPGKTLLLGREIEKCLSAMQEKELPAWAYFSSSLGSVKIPPTVKKVIVLNDYENGRDRGGVYNFKRHASKQGFRVSYEDKADIDPKRLEVRRSQHSTGT